ncbi:MAG: TonB-dependent receptor [Gammaproteobacteria bacterium]|nr:TonB-dependent receptor [Gammaproteobacteria bacterium]MBU1600819.1 TonB-dependent receptor [Gammaproteobacteria bacterium]MBU2435275.1 TonB-dependent receptor [Gammaproteobacteria bacterium]MBU2448689.1 TonB-dependent receptor [Gammaproteobacteria bacterium]
MGYRIRPLAAAMAVVFSAPIAYAQTTLNEVIVNASRIPEATSPRQIGQAEIAAKHAVTRDTAALLQDVPGVSLYGAGGVSSLPVIHGLADDRLRITVDGMDFIATCPNHMNPPLSYLDPTNVSKIKVYAGITPVSVGGDSIGGTIVAETAVPQFAAPGQGLLTKGEIGAFYRSNNNALGGNAGATLATENFSVSYSGVYSQADNYKAAGDFKSTTATGRPGHTLALDEVGSTAYETQTHTLGFALRGGNHLVEAKFGYQDVPKQLYPNQRMDMLGNEQYRANLRYLGQFDWGSAEIRAYHEQVKHFMEFGEDKKFLYTSGNTTQGMPMRSESTTTGASARFNIDLTSKDLLRVGAEYQSYKLDDWWPAVVGSMGMGPNDFQNINNGQRDRAALFGEWESRLNAQWTTQVGARYEYVRTSTNTVHGYNLATAPTSGSGGMMAQTTDAVAFNNGSRSKGDSNLDLTALTRFTPSTTADIEFGVARKVRSPNLYERYTWSTAGMMAIMNNFVGDGNGYVGNADLKPETAYTASATFDFHAADRSWEFKATPYYTHVDDYIDAIRCPSGSACTPTNSTTTNQYVVLKYTNQSARLYGLDLSGRMPLASTGVGTFGLNGLLGYTRGENRDTGGNLYNIMPLNAKVALTHQLGGWNNAIEVIGVTGKHDTSAVRNEIRTSGYSLTNLRASYTWNKVRVDFGVENLFDKFYYLPLGGAYTGQGTTMGINSIPWGIAVPGMGRSFYAGLNLKF